MGALEHDDLYKIAEYRLTLPDGAPVPATARIVGRGAELHLLNEGQWYQLALDQIPAL